MNPIQLEQVLPIAQTQDVPKSVKTGDTTFADALRAAREDRNEPAEAKKEPVSEREAKSELSQRDEKTAGETPEPSRENQQVAKAADEKQSPADKEEQTDEEISVLASETAVPLSVALSPSGEKIQNTENQKISALDSVEQGEDLAVSERLISWLAARTDDTESVSAGQDDDFAALIDAAVEFIPGAETDAEKLESAQSLAISDPELFLQKIHALSDGAVENQRVSDTAYDGKKTESKDKKSGAKISVHDMRSARPLSAETALSSEKTVQKVGGAGGKKEPSLSLGEQNGSAVQVTMELSERANQNITSSTAQTASAAGSDFQQMLSSAVQENAPEFVKAGNIVLKDNKSGIINLILKPESLGNVKISLNLNDKVISGQISVQTKEALAAFRESIDSLKQAFTQSGFETGSFDLNFSNGQQGFAQSSGNERQDMQQNSAYLADKSYGSYAIGGDGDSSGEVASYGAGSNYSVNIVA